MTEENIVSKKKKRRMWQFVVMTADLVSSIWTVGEFGGLDFRPRV